jgi:hypothetical protein
MDFELAADARIALERSVQASGEFVCGHRKWSWFLRLNGKGAERDGGQS